MNPILKTIQKETGIKQGNYTNLKNQLYNQCQTLLVMLKHLVNVAEANNMTSEQMWIDFEDELNAISIKDHNADLEN